MIDIEKTIYSTFQEKIDRLRFLADNDSLAFKKILYVIILLDLAEWSKVIEDENCTYNKLIKKANEFILRNPEFTIERITNSQLYRNVNTPLTIYTWQRIFDDPLVIYNRETESPIDVKDYSYTPDPTCSPTIVYFDSLDEIGEPKIDRSKLTVCEKMDLYINRKDGTVWYLKEDGNWCTLKSDVNSVEWDKISNKPIIYQGIEHNITDNNTVKVELLTESQPENEDVKVAGIEDLEDVL